MTVLIFILVLAALIFVHELGHFLVAKKSGIKVSEFGLGLPPRVWGKQVGETLYSINAIPFGGFVKIFGEDPHIENISPEEKNRSFYYKPKWIQAAVLSAGVIFNIIFAWLLLSFGFILGFSAPANYLSYAEVQNPEVVVLQALDGFPAKEAGLKSGDTILFVGSGEKSLQGEELIPENISNLISNSKPNENIELLIKRGEDRKSVIIEPVSNEQGQRMIGISMDMVGIIKLPIHLALYEGARATVLLTSQTVIGLGTFLWNIVSFNSDFSQVSGPVGVASMVGEASSLGFVFLLSFIALISINLAVINLVPFPALDGGRLLFVLVESIIRRPLPGSFVRWTNGLGFLLLLILMFTITIKDVLKLF